MFSSSNHHGFKDVRVQKRKKGREREREREGRKGTARAAMQRAKNRNPFAVFFSGSL